MRFGITTRRTRKSGLILYSKNSANGIRLSIALVIGSPEISNIIVNYTAREKML